MRILIVEDEHRIANTLKKGLEQERFAVDVVYDGLEGYDMAAAEDYDIIVLDVMLPSMDGIAICQKLRSEGKHMPILMLTARSETKDKVTGLNCGADDYLTKPFSFEELVARIRALLRRGYEKKQGTVLQVDDLQMDCELKQVRRAGKIIDISAKEFAALEYLLRNAGKILSKQQIIDHVWDYDADILPNTIEVYIKNLRAKLDSPFPQLSPLLHTVRGFGYRIGK